MLIAEPGESYYVCLSHDLPGWRRKGSEALRCAWSRAAFLTLWPAPASSDFSRMPRLDANAAVRERLAVRGPTAGLFGLRTLWAGRDCKNACEKGVLKISTGKMT